MNEWGNKIKLHQGVPDNKSTFGNLEITRDTKKIKWEGTYCFFEFVKKLGKFVTAAVFKMATNFIFVTVMPALYDVNR